MAILAVFFFTCYARGSAVYEAKQYARRLLKDYDERLGRAIRGD